MYEIAEMQKIEKKNKIITHHPQVNTRYNLGNPMQV
jgi:hypothetical protein